MQRRHFLAGLLLATGLSASHSRSSLVAADAQAAEQVPITVRVSDMHCAACAKKIARKLYAVPGVVKVRTDLKKHTAYVTPQADKAPSAKALWEAVEKAGFKPVALDGPLGKFAKKPAA